MLFGRNREKRERATNPSWLKWMVAVFIAYAIFTNYTNRKERVVDNRDSEMQQVQNSTYEAADLQTFTLPNNVKVTGEIKGQGQTAYCGMKATANITPILAGKDGDMVTQTVFVGVDTEESPWAMALQGMKEGGVRTISLSDKVDEKLLKTSEYKLELKDVTPDASGNDMIEYQAFERISGRGVTARCGLEADFSVILRDDTGAIAYNSAIDNSVLTTVIGTNDFFYGLEKGLLGMQPTGIRTLIIPPSHVALGNAMPDAMRQAVDASKMQIAEITLHKVRNPKLNAKPITLLPEKKDTEAAPQE